MLIRYINTHILTTTHIYVGVYTETHVIRLTIFFWARVAVKDYIPLTLSSLKI